MSGKIAAPDSEYNGTTRFGELVLEFKDGKASYDGELPDGVRQYMQGAGYKIDGKAIEQDQLAEIEQVDPRKVAELEQVGTPLRDAAVDPKPEDFLAPTNAGEANPHGPEVVSPEIHASQGVRPIKGGEVYVDEPDKQNDAELKHAAESTDGTPIVAPTVVDGPPVDVATEAGALPVKDQPAAAKAAAKKSTPAKKSTTKAAAKKSPAKKSTPKKG